MTFSCDASLLRKCRLKAIHLGWSQRRKYPQDWSWFRRWSALYSTFLEISQSSTKAPLTLTLTEVVRSLRFYFPKCKAGCRCVEFQLEIQIDRVDFPPQFRLIIFTPDLLHHALFWSQTWLFWEHYWTNQHQRVMIGFTGCLSFPFYPKRCCSILFIA